jgi:hypothetical protein
VLQDNACLPIGRDGHFAFRSLTPTPPLQVERDLKRGKWFYYYKQFLKK